jgi:hypothetical protein
MSFTYKRLLSIAVLYLIGTRGMWLVEMRITLGRLLSIAQHSFYNSYSHMPQHTYFTYQL